MQEELEREQAFLGVGSECLQLGSHLCGLYRPLGHCCRRSKPACRAAVACAYSRPRSCPGHRSPGRRSATGGFVIAALLVIAVVVPVRHSKPGCRSGGYRNRRSSVEVQRRAAARSVTSGGPMKPSARAASRGREVRPSVRSGVIGASDGKFELGLSGNGQQQAKSP